MDTVEFQNQNIGFKEHIYQILDIPSDNDRISRGFDIFMMALIGLNVIALVLQTVESIEAKYFHFFYSFEVFSVVIFTIEYLLRIWVCTANENFSKPLIGRLKFCLKPLLIIDLLAIVPFYLPFLGVDLRFLRVFRLFRLFRIVKLARYSQSLRLFGLVINRKKEELVISLSFLLLLLILSSFLMYDAEHKVQPENFSNIFDAFWWGVVTFSTVGYGDIYPKTEIGKFIASVSTIIGIMIFALPTSILTAGFMEEYQENRQNDCCPHCGKKNN